MQMVEVELIEVATKKTRKPNKPRDGFVSSRSKNYMDALEIKGAPGFIANDGMESKKLLDSLKQWARQRAKEGLYGLLVTDGNRRVQDVDKDGNLLFDEEGKPVIKKEPKLDGNKLPILDEKGEPVMQDVREAGFILRKIPADEVKFRPRKKKLEVVAPITMPEVAVALAPVEA